MLTLLGNEINQRLYPLVPSALDSLVKCTLEDPQLIARFLSSGEVRGHLYTNMLRIKNSKVNNHCTASRWDLIPAKHNKKKRIPWLVNYREIRKY